MFDTNSAQTPTESYIRDLAPRTTKKRRIPNYRAKNTAATIRKQEAIREWLSLGEGLTIKELAIATGMSRQLALYHVKKMAAQGLLVMQLEPCEVNGGVQFRVWDENALMGHYVRRMTAPRIAA